MGIEGQTNLMDIHRAFEETEFGQTLAAQVRYNRYKPDDVDNKRWVELLGADVNNLTHLPLTYGLTRDMIQQLRLTQPGFLMPDEEAVLGVAALIHDWAEAIVGDISYSDKTAEDEAQEQKQLTVILDQFDSQAAGEVKVLIERAVGEVVFSHDTKLGKIFNTVERVGYLRTALRASEHVINGTAADCTEGLRWIVADVLGNHCLTLLVERSLLYLPVDNYLLYKRRALGNAFAVVTTETFMNYPADKRQAETDDFYQARAAFLGWNQRYQNNN